MSDYTVTYLDKSGKPTSNAKDAKLIRVNSVSNPNNYADYRRLHLRDPHTGKIFGTAGVTSLAQITNFEGLARQGSGEGAILSMHIEEAENLEDFEEISSSSPLLHFRGNTEHSFTSTGNKLAYHWPIFKKLGETGYGSIVRATMTFHQKCSSKCPYCSTINRSEADSISLDEAKQFVEELYQKQASFNQTKFAAYNAEYKAETGCDIRLRSLIMSGGGQPNLWPHFSEFVNWVRKETDIKLGLITNGFPKNIPDDVYENFEWIRISITPSDASPFYVDGKFDKQYFPSTLFKHRNASQKIGFSYVYGPWSTDDDLIYIDDAAKRLGFDYVRLLTDCTLARSSQLEAHRILSNALLRLGLIREDGVPTSKSFHQLKYHADAQEADSIWPEGQCMLQSYNVFWDTTGHAKNGRSFCYPCDSVTVLTNEAIEGTDITNSSRVFDGGKWGTVTNDEVASLYTKPLTAYFDPREQCKACLFANNNKRAYRLKTMTINEYQDLKVDLISKKAPFHVEFP